MSAFPPHRVDRLVRGNRIKPGLDGSALLIALDFHVKLEKRVLKHVLGKSTVAEIAAQIAEQFALKSANQNGKSVLSPFAETQQKLFIRAVCQFISSFHDSSAIDTRMCSRRF